MLLNCTIKDDYSGKLYVLCMLPQLKKKKSLLSMNSQTGGRGGGAGQMEQGEGKLGGNAPRW